MKPLYLTAHYDDLEICAGGTAARFGGETNVLTPRPAALRSEWQEATTVLKLIPGLHCYSKGQTTVVQYLDDIVASGTYTHIITNSPFDSHPDHREAADIARQVARKNYMALWYMDHAIPGGLAGPRPNHFVDISEHYLTKNRALNAYQSQLRKYGQGWRDAIVGRDTYYGWMHGVGRAEGFTVANQIQ